MDSNAGMIMISDFFVGGKRSSLPRVQITRSSGTQSDNRTSGSARRKPPSAADSSPAPSRASSPSSLSFPCTPSWMSSQPGTSYQPESSYEHEEATQNEMPSQDQLQELLSMFPSVSADGVKFLFKISNQNAVAVTDCLVNLNVEGILEILRPAIISDSPRKLRLDEDDWDSDESLAESLIAYYKDYKFNSHAAIRVCIPHQPVIDTGGARRQLYSRVLATVAESEKFSLFEGPPGRLRPAFKQSSVSSGLLHILGRMIGHSIIMDTQGFPFLSPPCYYYMCGYHDRALSLVQLEDVGENVSHVIEQVIALCLPLDIITYFLLLLDQQCN